MAGEIIYSPEGIAIRNDSSASHPVPGDGNLTSLGVNPFLNTMDGNTVVTLLVNGADTSLEIIIPAFSTGVQVVTLNVPVSSGDSVTLRSDGANAANGGLGCFATYEYKRE